MQKIKDTIYYAASDIVNFLECEHLTALDLINLEIPLPQSEDDEEAVLYQSSFQSFWAHDRHEERQAFEQFMDFVAGHLRKHPHARIYHYAHYEETALQRLMFFHGTREAEVDNLLHFGKLID